MDFATVNGTAIAGSDYVTSSGTLTFSSTVTSAPIVITINADLVVEPNETFHVVLRNPRRRDLAGC